MTDEDFKILKRRLTTAKRELRKAVERWQKAEHSGVDFRDGHRIEAVRQAREIKAECDKLVALLMEACK